MAYQLKMPWSSSCQNVLQHLHVSADKGLPAVEVKIRRKKYGYNRLKEIKKKSAWLILTNQFKSIIVLLLGVASVVSIAFGEWMESFAILGVIAINAMIGFFTEMRAVRSMEALRLLSSVNSKVRREGQIKEIHAQELVPGDIVLFEGGDIVTADLRLIKASKLQADESALTGESIPVSKEIEPLAEDVPMVERTNILYKGTAITRGSGEGVVVAIGMNTELGKISSLVEEAEEEITPLEKRLNKLGHKLIWATLILVVLVALGGILTGKNTFLMIETSIALAVAAIPEGLPIVATIALARGIWRMARHNALINRLSAVETLGATNIICTDKTGTLTENRMTVTQLNIHSGEINISHGPTNNKNIITQDGKSIDPLKNKVVHQTLIVGMLCSNASLQKDSKGRIKAIGEPLESALLIAGVQAGINHEKLIKDMPEVREEAFDPDNKMMATFNKQNNQYFIAVKGAPESILEVCTHFLTEKGMKEMNSEERKQWLEQNERMAAQGLRVIGLATKTTKDHSSNPYEGLTLLGLIGLLDPSRKDVRKSIDLCHNAGIRVIMITGDQPVTAKNIGLAVGLIDNNKTDVIIGKKLKSPVKLSRKDKLRIIAASIFARVNPKQKLDLIELHQKSGSIVAMIGDGVNDAPALKKADIGVAMGQRGTQVAREAADMILKDDAFSTIITAIEQGRIIFNNIRKFVCYLISCNVSEIMAIFLASVLNIPLPILPLQILFLNLVTDVFPALALGMGEGNPGTMDLPPRDPKENILKRSHWLAIGGYAFLITLSVIGALVLAITWLGMDEKQAVTVSFLTLAFAQLWHAFNMRDRDSSLLLNDITRNPFIWGSLTMCSGLLIAGVYLPGLSHVLKVINPGIRGWIIIIIMSLMPLVFGQLFSTLIPQSRSLVKSLINKKQKLAK